MTKPKRVNRTNLEAAFSSSKAYYYIYIHNINSHQVKQAREHCKQKQNALGSLVQTNSQKYFIKKNATVPGSVCAGRRHHPYHTPGALVSAMTSVSSALLLQV